jgi:uncharacterized protein (DUF433 family)
MVQPDVIMRDPEVLGGTPVFAHTRVPVQTLLDYLEGNHSIEDFLDDFPTVQRDQAIAILKEFGHMLLAQPA